jgi:DNA repair exonuclease SbcCD ATPase subunit
MVRSCSIVLLGALVAGCATTEQTAALECGAGGAGGAFLLCKLAGGSDATCAAVGGGVGAAGAAGCYAWSSHLKKEREALAGHENDLDARLAFARSVNDTMSKYNDSLRQKVAELSQHSTATARQISVQTNDETQLTSQRRKIDETLKEANASIAEQKQTLAEMRNFQAQHASHSESLATEIRREEANLQDTQRQASALANLKQNV